MAVRFDWRQIFQAMFAFGYKRLFVEMRCFTATWLYFDSESGRLVARDHCYKFFSWTNSKNLDFIGEFVVHVDLWLVLTCIEMQNLTSFLRPKFLGKLSLMVFIKIKPWDNKSWRFFLLRCHYSLIIRLRSKLLLIGTTFGTRLFQLNLKTYFGTLADICF